MKCFSNSLLISSKSLLLLPHSLLPGTFPDTPALNLSHFLIDATTASSFRLVLEQLDDIKLDAPLAPKIVGQFLGGAILDNFLEPSFLVPSLKPVVESGSAVAVLGGLLNFYIENTVRKQSR